MALPATLKSASPMQWVRNMMSAYKRYLQYTQVVFSKGHHVYRWPHSESCLDFTGGSDHSSKLTHPYFEFAGRMSGQAGHLAYLVIMPSSVGSVDYLSATYQFGIPRTQPINMLQLSSSQFWLATMQ